MNMNTLQDRIRGSLIGGAIGDALGYPVEFMPLQEIKKKYGKEGITRYDVGKDGIAYFSDDTQMTLFTANGYLFGETRLCMRGIAGNATNYIQQAYIEWLQTQTTVPQVDDYRYHTCWIRDIAALNKNRAPGNTCMSALESLRDGHHVGNNSKGCGGVMRVSPLGLRYAAGMAHGDTWKEKDIFQLGYGCAYITHKHPLGCLPAGYLSLLLFRLCGKEENVTSLDFEQMVLNLCEELQKISSDSHYASELSQMLHNAVNLAKGEGKDDENIKLLGEGWTGDEALAIAVYCALRHFDSFEDAIVAAVNHDGDSDSTGAICGNIMGLVFGYEAIPQYYKQNLELADLIIAMADDLMQGCNISEYGSNDSPEQIQWMSRYVDIYPYGFPHLEMIRYMSCYPIPGVYEAPDKLWPDIDALLKENIPELFFFNDEKSHSREESILCLWWPCKVVIEGVVYNSVGQFIEAEKARLFGDLKTRDKILRVSSKNEILALGKRIMGYNESKWRDIDYAVVLYGNYYKFQKNEECRNELLKTKDYILVYDISTDTDWGAGFKRTDSKIFNPNNWDINNLLGFTLMEVRKLITRSAMKKVLTTWTKKMKFDQNDENYINSLIAKEAWKEAIEFKEKLFLEHRYEVAEKNAKTCSGVFTAHGMVLLDFKPDKENVIMNEDGHCMLRNLVFPQTDITYIADGVFNGIEVRGELQLPNKTIGIGMKGGEGVFKNCKFSKLYIPSEVSSLGDYAFAKCEIGVLKLYPSALKSEYGRQFKGATIEKLYLPENSLPMSCSEYGVLHSIAVNASVKEVYLDKFVHLSWEDFVKQI